MQYRRSRVGAGEVVGGVGALVAARGGASLIEDDHVGMAARLDANK